MRSIWLWAALLALSGAGIAGATDPLPFRPFLPIGSGGGGGEGPMHLRADRLLHHLKEERWTAIGRVVLRSPELHVRADELIWDEAQRRVTARGNVLVVQEGYVAVAEEIEVEVETNRVRLVDGMIVGKSRISRAALEAATSREALLSLGRNELAIRGERITRVSQDHFQVEGLSFTPCDCDLASPTWAVRAALADVYPGEHAVLRGWKVEVQDVQVTPTLPVLDLPLADRRTGLLIPTPSFSQVGGFGLTQPFFLVLGRSHDLTLTPGYSFGPNPFNYGMRGPSLGAEYRYTPAVGVEGRLAVTGFWDLREDRAPRSSRLLEGTQRGLRWNALFEHRQILTDSLKLMADVRLVSDGYFTRDMTTDILLRENQVLRSTLGLFTTRQEWFAGLDAILRQDLRTGDRFEFFFEDPRAVRDHPRAPVAMHRLPGLVVSVPDRRLVGPLFGSMRVDATRLAPWVGPGGDEGLNGYSSVAFAPARPREGEDRYAPLRAPDEGEGNGLFDPGESERRVRLELKPTLSVPASVGPVALLAQAGFRQSLTLGEITGRAEARGLPLIGASAETRIRGGFELDGGRRLIHSIAPTARALWVPFTVGGLSGGGELFDTPFTLGLSSLEQPARLAQATVAVRQRLDLQQAGGQLATELVMLEVGQNLSLINAGLPGTTGSALADTFARLEARAAGFRVSARVQIDPTELALIQAAATAGYSARAFGVAARYERLRHEGSATLLRGIDALFGVGTRIPASTHAEQVRLSANARTPLHGLTLRASALFQPGYTIAGGERDGAIRPFAQGTAGLNYAPACDCWSVTLVGGATRASSGAYVPVVSASLTLANFGSLGTQL